MNAAPLQQPEALTAEIVLEQAVAHHRAGRVQEAERLYRAILHAVPNHSDANHNLGVLAVQVKQPVASLPYLQAALEANPNHGQYWLSYIDALIQANQFETARLVLARGRKLGLQGAKIEALADHLGDIVRAEEETSGEQSVFLASQKTSLQRASAVGVKAKKKDLRKRKTPSSQEIDAVIVAYNEGRNLEAARLAKGMINAFPEYPLGWKISGAVFKQMGKSEDALASMRKAATLAPEEAEVHYNLGILLQEAGRQEEALISYKLALKINPNLARAHYNLGIVLRDVGRTEDAEASYRRALEIDPGHAKALANLGNVLQDQGRLNEAIESYHRALSIKPDFAEVCSDLGNALQEQGKLNEAIESYQRALSIRPEFSDAYCNLGNAYQAQGKLDEAMTCYKKSLGIQPDFAEVYSNLGSVLKLQGKLDEAVICHRKALAFKPTLATGINRLGNALLEQGMWNDAIACYRQALTIREDYANVRSNLLLAIHYTEKFSPEEVFEEHQRYAEFYEKPLKQYWKAHHKAKAPNERMRVGYISADFRMHSVAYFIESVINKHDKSKFEIFCYFNSTQIDSVTQRFILLADHWVACRGMTDEQLAEKVHEDKIDILVDLAGHTADNRLLTFARKPAPVQVTYLGYPNTTGLAAIDYRLTDSYADPVGLGDELYTETLIRLPKTFLCYCPPKDAPEVQALPAINNHFVTFGSFNAFQKITDSVIVLWSNILLSIPGSKIMLKAAGLDQPSIRNKLLMLFEQCGISEKQLILLSKSNEFKEHLSQYHRVDICLDPFPYNGTTTTCEALWMGVPVITHRGDRHSSRVGTSLLVNLGLEELIAESPDEYIKIAIDLAVDIQRLANMRAGLRQRMMDSSLLDSVGFTRTIENAYQDMWSNYLLAAK